MAGRRRPRDGIAAKIKMFQNRAGLPITYQKGALADLVHHLDGVLLYYRNQPEEVQAALYSQLLSEMIADPDTHDGPIIKLLSHCLSLSQTPFEELAPASLHGSLARLLENRPELWETYGTPEYHREQALQYPEP